MSENTGHNMKYVNGQTPSVWLVVERVIVAVFIENIKHSSVCVAHILVILYWW